MKTKGFTLIELLAVIVILAIIALIAVPIILGIIGDSKKESQKRSIDMYADAIKIAIAKASITGEVPSGSYKPEAESKSIKLKDGDYTLPVDYDKSIVECETTELYKDGTIYLADCKVNGEDVYYTYGAKQEETKNKVYANGDEVYFDVKLGTSCTNYVEANSADGYKGVETPTEANNNCLKFYAFLDDEESSTVNLILDHNTTARIAWVSKEDYNDDTNWGYDGNANKGPLTLLKQLKMDTEDWQGTEVPTSYIGTINTGYPENADVTYTIDYGDYGNKARLITAEEISKIIGNESLDYYPAIDFGSGYGWLYDRTSTSCTTYGCLNNSTAATYGYWTASAFPKLNWQAIFVGECGRIGVDDFSLNYDYFGVRPVIEVLKSNLS